MNFPTTRRTLRALTFTALFACGFATAAAVATAQTGQTSIRTENGRHAGELVIPFNKSTILQVDRPYKDLLVGNPKIADVLPLTDRSVYVLGKALGSTSLSIYSAGKRLIAVADILVAHDVEGLKAKLFEMLPKEKIEVRAVGASLILSGTVSSSARMDQALSIADSVAPKAVKNHMKVAGSQQVLLEVRFAEMARTTAKELGFNFDSLVSAGRFAFGLATNLPTTISGVFPDGTIATRNLGLAGDSTNTLFGSFSDGRSAATSAIDALEEKGLVKVLAEPNLIALSGETAKFLAGGEFPIPVAQDNDTVTIEFKEFGVSLAFTPTVLQDGLINLVVAPEVSQIDTSTSISTLGGVNIPGLTTRRAKTTVELGDGQSFAVAGLLQSNFADTVRQLPWAGDIPVIGALLRSTRFQREETELVIIVTPRLVKPAKAGTLAAPTDGFQPPSEGDLFLLGRLEGRKADGAGKTGNAAKVLTIQNAGGIDGPHGHIIK